MGGGLLVAWVVNANQRSAERVPLEADIAASLELHRVGPAVGVLLRYQAAQETRWLLDEWGIAEVILGASLFLYLLFASREGTASLLLAAILLAAALLQRTILTPEMAALGRALDFPDARELAGESGRLSAFSAIYLVVELVQWAAGLWLAGRLIAQRRGRSGGGRSENAWQKIDPVDKANYRRVNR